MHSFLAASVAKNRKPGSEAIYILLSNLLAKLRLITIFFVRYTRLSEKDHLVWSDAVFIGILARWVIKKGHSKRLCLSIS